MTKLWMGLFGLGVVLALTGCAGAGCQEECSEDADCGGGLMCANSDEGPVCVPADCDSCAKSCLYTVTDDGGDRTCSFNRCI